MYIGYNNSLSSLTGLDALASVGGVLTVSSNSELLRSLTGLENLTSVGGIVLYNNTALTSLTSLNALSSVGGYIQIFSNSALTSLTGLEILLLLVKIFKFLAIQH